MGENNITPYEQRNDSTKEQAKHMGLAARYISKSANGQTATRHGEKETTTVAQYKKTMLVSYVYRSSTKK